MAEKKLVMSAAEENEKSGQSKDPKKKKANVKSIKIKGYTPFKVHAGKAIP